MLHRGESGEIGAEYRIYGRMCKVSPLLSMVCQSVCGKCLALVQASRGAGHSRSATPSCPSWRASP